MAETSRKVGLWHDADDHCQHFAYLSDRPCLHPGGDYLPVYAVQQTTEWLDPWRDPRVAVMVEHWEETDPDNIDPSWPTVALRTLQALSAAGYEVVER